MIADSFKKKRWFSNKGLFLVPPKLTTLLELENTTGEVLHAQLRVQASPNTVSWPGAMPGC